MLLKVNHFFKLHISNIYEINIMWSTNFLLGHYFKTTHQLFSKRGIHRLQCLCEEVNIRNLYSYNIHVQYTPALILKNVLLEFQLFEEVMKLLSTKY